MTDHSRRDLLKWIGWLSAGAALTAAGCTPGTEPPAQDSATVTRGAPTQRPTLVPTARPTSSGVTASPTQDTATQPAAAAATDEPVAPSPTATVDEVSEGATTPPSVDPAYLSVVHGADPAAITRAAVEALGGIGRFVSPGDDVIVKPNICVNYHSFEYAATTNPTVVATLVHLALDAGAKRVRVMDTPYTGDPETAYRRSGIWDAVVAAGGQMEIISGVKFGEFDIPDGRDIKSWTIYRDIVEADVLINVPIAKQHGSSGLTLACKNLMGIIQRPNQFHRNLHQRIADLNSRVRSTLTVVDAVRILTAHGPGGGNLDDVKKLDTVIASHDIITADAYATSLFGLTPDDIGYIRLGAEMGLGQKDWGAVTIAETTL